MQIGHFVTEIIYQGMADVLPDRVIIDQAATARMRKKVIEDRSKR